MARVKGPGVPSGSGISGTPEAPRGLALELELELEPAPEC